MKRVVLGLMAACAVGMAQAVTAGWTDWQNIAITNGQGQTTIAGGSSFAVQVIFSDVTAKSTGWRFFLDVAQGTTSKVNIENNGAGNLYTWNASGDSASQTPIADLLTGDNKELKLSVQYNAATDIVQVFANDTLYLTSTYGLDALGDLTVVIGNAAAGGRPLSAAFDYTITSAQYSTTLLPEPTVLALLALGVAGVALRRRVV